jgi:preprotein translocase subunit SecY
MTLAARRIAIQIPQRTMAVGGSARRPRTSSRCASTRAGVMPIIFAQSRDRRAGRDRAVLRQPAPAATSPSCSARGTWLYFVVSRGADHLLHVLLHVHHLQSGRPGREPEEAGRVHPGIKPGAKTAEYIDHVVTRITLPGAVFLTVIALMPIWLADMFAVPFQFGGTSLLIVVGVALDTMSQMQQHLLLRKYDGFMKKGRVRFRGRAQPPASEARGVIVVCSGRRAQGRARRASGWPLALGVPKIATGDVLRAAVKRGTPLGLEAKASWTAATSSPMR